jgi:hypothetical protein
VTLWDRVQLTGDAAWLPYVSFTGVDNHLLRGEVANTISPESGRGQGVQLETILSYSVTPALNIGAGGRYWAMWATTGASTDLFSQGCPCQTLPARTERYGASCKRPTNSTVSNGGEAAFATHPASFRRAGALA